MHESLLHLTEFSLVWGPLDLPEPAYSFDEAWEPQIYTPDEVAGAILAVPGTTLIRPASPGWESWAARWQSAGRAIEFDMATLDLDPGYWPRPGVTLAWGGSNFVAHCLLADVLTVWGRIQERCPAVWLHDTDCRMYSRESFARRFPIEPDHPPRA